MRRMAWVKAALKDFREFPAVVQEQAITALRIAAHGEKADTAKPLKGFGSGVLEIVLRSRGDGYRAVYALKFAGEVWGLHAFQKKSKEGIKTPKHDIDVIRTRLKSLEAMFR